MPFGLTETGFEPETLRDVLDDIETDQRADISPALDVTPSSPDGQRNAVTARQAALLWELVNALAEQMDPDKAEDDQLVSVAKITGTVPQGETAGTVTAQCLLESGTELLTGEHFANVPGRSEQWTPVADFTAPADGVHDVPFLCTVTGPIPAFAGTLTEYVGPAGWTSVSNALDAVQGLPADTNETLRARREADLARAGSATARAVRADLLAAEASPGVKLFQDVRVLENDTSVTDSNGVAPKSLECVVADSPAVADTVIAQLILDAKAGGIGTSGAVLSAGVDEFGKDHPIRFSRPTLVPVYLAYTVQVQPGFDAAVFAAAVVEQLTASHGTGAVLRHWECETAAKQPLVTDLASVYLGLTGVPPPALTDNLVPSARARLTFDTSRVTVAVTVVS